MLPSTKNNRVEDYYNPEKQKKNRFWKLPKDFWYFRWFLQCSRSAPPFRKDLLIYNNIVRPYLHSRLKVFSFRYNGKATIHQENRQLVTVKWLSAICVCGCKSRYLLVPFYGLLPTMCRHCWHSKRMAPFTVWKLK